MPSNNIKISNNFLNLKISNKKNFFIKKQVNNIKEVLGVTGKLFMTLMKSIPQQNLKGQTNLSLIFF